MQDSGGNLRPPGQHMTERRTQAAMNDPQLDHNEAKAVEEIFENSHDKVVFLM